MLPTPTPLRIDVYSDPPIGTQDLPCNGRMHYKIGVTEYIDSAVIEVYIRGTLFVQKEIAKFLHLMCPSGIMFMQNRS